MRWQWLGGKGEIRSAMQNRGFKSLLHEGQLEIRRAEDSGELLVCVGFSHCQLLGISFYQPRCCGYCFITHTHPPIMVSMVTWLLDPLPRALSSGASWLNVAEE